MTMKVNFEVFKEPRAFIKILEIGIAVFAFATTAGYYSSYLVTSKLAHSKTCPLANGTFPSEVMYRIEGRFEYPFDDGMVYMSYGSDAATKCVPDRNGSYPLQIDGKHKSEAQFFVFVGAFAFIYCVFACFYYAVLENPEEAMHTMNVGWCSFVVIDFLIGVLIIVFWFAGSVAWAAGLPGLKDDTDPDIFVDHPTAFCKDKFVCHVSKNPNYATLKVSIILGFLNLFVWLGNLWFLFKETPWHNPQQQTYVQSDSVQ